MIMMEVRDQPALAQLATDVHSIRKGLERSIVPPDGIVMLSSEIPHNYVQNPLFDKVGRVPCRATRIVVRLSR